jgi:hypothetical protein
MLGRLYRAMLPQGGLILFSYFYALQVRDAYGRWLRLRGHVDASDLMQLYEAGNSDAQMEYVHLYRFTIHAKI